jgi:dethiobiotin synthase
MSLFVLGTDTEVGKTVVAALICQRYRMLPGIAYWKPVASGSEAAGGGEAGDGVPLASVDRLAVSALLAETAGERTTTGPAMLAERYSFTDPVSPHLAARRTDQRIEVARLVASLDAHHAAHKRLVIEGIGGALVPLNDDGDLFADWVAQSGLPAVVVARTAIGTINHTLLTLEALRQRQVVVAGVVMNGDPDAENRRAIERFGAVTVVAEVPRVEALDPASLARLADAFDPEDCLRSMLERS